MKAFHEDKEPVETTSESTLRAVPPAIEVAPGVFMTPGKKRTGQDANAYLLDKNAELYRRLAK